MTRKDYELLAAHLNTGRQLTPEGDARFGYDVAVSRVILALAADNPRFDQARFLVASGLVK